MRDIDPTELAQWKATIREDVAWAARFMEVWVGWADPEPGGPFAGSSPRGCGG
jgi:hypothetical protein